MRISPPADKSGLLGRGGAEESLEGVRELLLRRTFFRHVRNGEGLRFESSSSFNKGGLFAIGRGFNATGVCKKATTLNASSSMVNSETCSNTPTRSEFLLFANMLASASSK